MLIHGTCVGMMDGKGAALILGDSGAGKSDLALRLIAKGCKLIADDQVELSRKGKAVRASAPKQLKGMLEVRGVGIVRLPTSKTLPVRLVVRISNKRSVRLPEAQTHTLHGIKIPEITLDAFEASAPEKLVLAYEVARHKIPMKSGFIKA